MPSIEIKLHNIPEAGYRATAASPSPPHGEILLRGPSVTPSYYRRPDLNVDPTVFTADGWFRTCNICMWNAHGSLSTIDRCAQTNAAHSSRQLD